MEFYGFTNQAEYDRVFKMAFHPAFDGYTFGDLPGRYIVSETGELLLPVSAIHAGNGRWRWDSYYQSVALRAVNRAGYAPGVWLDHSRKSFVFDVSTSFDNFGEANIFGIKNKQNCMYDQETGSYPSVV